MTSRTREAKGAKFVAAPAKKSRFRFFAEVIGELKKARWPTRQEALRLSGLVLIICIIIGLILGFVDWGFTKLVTRVFMGG